MKKSRSSTIVFVKPHAVLSFWPITGKGIPAIQTPETLNLPPERCISYHLGGWEKARCGSFARKGWPVTVRDGDTTQLFDPISAATSPKRFRTPYSLSSTLFKLPIILVGKPPAIVGISTCSSGSMSFNISLPKYDSTAPKITSGFHDPDISCAIILA